ncbi:hypothetical protein ACJMK2_021695 [Sinanodonta woodiana]|uniref:Cubilin n=1 Tax=Sinanodonta woodiana TaxID=1069815 RepID=A0ABD3TGU7_SINWO
MSFVRANRDAIIQLQTAPTVIPPNIENRLRQLEAGIANLQPTGQVQSLLNDLTSRITRVESRVQQLETEVTQLRNLLTTNECSSNPCRNGGTCVDTYNGFFCRCLDAWQGTTCETDVNECAVYAGTDLGCQNGATCVNSPGSFMCQCTPDWHGVRCTERHDDCTGASNEQLCGHGTCVNNPRVQPGQPKYTCICDSGWTKSGSAPACTVDVDECNSNRPPCSQDPPVMCINLPGSFQCGPCPTGFTGNGFSCVDINECQINNGGCSMIPTVQCINTRGSRQCGPCPPGYQGDGVTCTWVGVCNVNNGGCHPLARCTESPGVSGRYCACPPGYVGNGEGPAGCVPQGPITGACGSSPCMNGAVCQNNGDSFICTCQPGYTGQRCETNINECSSSPCQNGGTCTDRLNGFECTCPNGYTGVRCEQTLEACGGLLSGENGSLSYPAVSGDQAPHDVSCAWSITTTFGKILMINFTRFNIEAHRDCSYDFLQIHDGPTASSYMIGKYCGSTPPNNGQPINSTHHQLYLWFKSDATVASDGFQVQWRSALPVCGGDLRGQNYGSISSPGYPGNYPHDRTCVWTIEVQPGNKIMFSFATVAIETHPNCSFDYLEVRDGMLDSSAVLKRYCSTVSPPPLSTTGPYAWVKFHSDSSMNDRGFHITYASVPIGDQCGGTYTSETGVLISPNYPNHYNNDATCVWVITVGTRDLLTLTFTNMDLEGHGICTYDYVEVRDGADETAPLLGRYCGNQIPATLTTTQNSLFVKFRSDISVASSGFRATWAVGCGGTFTTPTGILRSPFYPESYPHNRECIYLISLPLGSRAILTFNNFSIEGPSSTGSCSYDYLEIRDGGTEDAPLIGHFCGSQIPAPQESTNNLMWLKFKTDGSRSNTGFEAIYETREGGCGGTLTGNSGIFTSPGHPNVYPHGVNCSWLITGSPGLVIRLTFNTFSMESHPSCNYDYVEVYDNSTVVPSSKLGRYCGSMYPPTLTSTNNVMVVLFVSDSSLAHEGFSASYVALNASTLCGSELTASTGVITSPNFPNNYPHQRECVWTIVAPFGNQILLNITDFEVENHLNCIYDYLEIRNGGFATSPLVGTYCGTNIDRIIVSHSNRMYLKFKTDNTQSARGFRLSYDSTATGCGGDLSTPTGSFVSPNYPMPNGHNAECFWRIQVSRGSTIQLVFVDLDVETHASCAYDYVEVRETNALGRLLGKFCGTSVPDPISSTTNQLWVKYRTDLSVAGRGFHAFYMSNCNNRLTSFSGVIESPNFPNPYPYNRNCTWIIDTSLGNTINMSFSHFDLETHTSCRYDHLEIRDGENANASLIGNFCGTSLPPPIASSGDVLWIQFVSDHSVARNGFRLEYITNGCGGYLTGATGEFTSPNYPNPYPHRRECVWIVTVSTGSYVQLTITDFDLESHSECRYDVLEVYGGSDDMAPRLARLCHTQTSPQVLTSTGNMLFVRFRSDLSMSGKGFRAQYKALFGGCGGNFTTPTGTIVSRNYPNNYPHNTDCEWLITVPEKRNVYLTFEDFDVEGSSDCRFDYVAVYDGMTVNSTELIRHCGNSLPVPSVYQTNSNTMYIRMRSDGTVAARGFKASYKIGCGGIMNAEVDGEISSSNYPRIYDRSSNCSWLIQADHSSDRVTLTFTHMDIEEVADCGHDYVTVMDGNDESAPLIGTYCGNVVPLPITSQGSALYVKFISDFSVQRTGFRAVYTKSASSCGGDFTAEQGSFASPGYPNSYPVNTECVWTVRAAPGNFLQLSFSLFHLESQENCNNDYLELRKGSVSGNLIGRFCGSVMPTNITALNGIWMKFRSNPTSTGQGFVAQYSTSYGGALTGSSGQVASPLYPSQYPFNVDYTWTITVDTGMRIRIIFETLDMESSSMGCVFDFVKFRDGGQPDSPVLGSFCGITPPDPFVSSTNVLFVEFHSDFSSSGQGFLFNWQATSDQPISTTPAPGSTTPVPGCGGVLVATEAAQTVISPGYPNGYPSSLDCVWTVSTPVGTRVWINITYIDLESHSTCNYDTLTIYDHFTTTGRILGVFCGRIGNPIPLLSSTRYATLRFKSDSSINGTGFALSYKSVCGGTIQSTSATLTSPGYPNSYPVNSNCTWNVQVPTGRNISVEFNGTFGIQGTQGSCGGDYIQLLNGFYYNSPPLGPSTSGRYCGNMAPARLETSSNFLYINFISDGSGTAAGFNLIFNQISVTCGGQIQLSNNGNSSVFSSPNYPNNYPHNVDCMWVITAPASKRIQVDFTGNFSIETHAQCNFDYVEFHDGGTINSPVISRFCGSDRPGTVFSTGNVLFVRFRTDASVPRTGFQAISKIATCGGHYVGQRGVITSPNYPSNYDNNADCIWTVSGPTGHYLTFTFTTFNLEAAVNCTSADYLEIRDYNATGDILLQACGSRIPVPVVTSDSFAYLRLKTNNGVVQLGFSLNFEASVEECGGILLTPTGTIQSPNFPGNYPHSRSCIWRITVQTGRRVSLTFNTMNIESQNTCFYDYVAVYNGILQDSPMIGRYCGSQPQTVVESSGNSMTVLFRSDGSVSNGGFQATYTSNNEATCGGSLSSSSGNISSPGYDMGNYTNSQECIWVLNNANPSNSSIVIYIWDLKLEHHDRCLYDLVEFKEGYNSDGIVLDQFCGNRTGAQVLITPSKYMWIRFKSDTSVVDRGFFLIYNFTACGGTLTNPFGTISSPNYPNNYDHNDACSWLIMAPEGTQIRIDFHELNMERHPSCNYDYLELFNGPYASSPSIGRMCGDSLPASFTSQSNAVRINFFTDTSMSARGFMLTYTFITGGCGGLYHSSSGFLSSPNWPRSYPHNVECIWDIIVQTGYFVQLIFNPPFDLEFHGACDNDYVEVSDSIPNGTLFPLGRWCQNIEPPVQSSSSTRMVVKFRSDAFTNGNGFSANWTAVCGGVLKASAGILTSPGFPSNYENNLNCNYTIVSDPQKFIVLEFDPDNFILEAGLSCQFDYLAVYEGNDTSRRFLAKVCGRTVPQPLSAIGSMFIQFVTDRTLTYRGFRATYRTSDCGGNFTAPYGIIKTPTHPVNYHNEANCTWLLTVQPNRVVDLKFLEFDLETHSTCNYDYVDIRDGSDLNARLIGRYCGNVVPGFIRSTGNSMIINFISDSSVTSKGFQAAYRQTYGIYQGCGGVLNQTSGSISSIESNGSYANDLDCRWTIFVGDNKVVKLTIRNMEIENHATCRYDFIRVYDGLSMEDPVIGTYCGNNTPSAITSTSNVLLVQFYTDGSIAQRGFNATYAQEDALCGGILTASAGPRTITSPLFPNPYLQDVRCRWTIDTPEANQQLHMTISDLSLLNSTNCITEYLEIKDYPLGLMGKSVHYCANQRPPPFDSVGRTVQINYAVTSASRSRGFSLNYTIASCNRTYTGSNGQLFSPGYPGSYPRNANCQIRISAPSGTTLSLYFNSLRIEPHPNCSYDYLEIKNGSTSVSPLLARLCGFSLPNPIFAATNEIWLNFITDNSVVHQGYDITYTTTTQGVGCGGTLTGINGSLTSPGYPGNYTTGTTCTWLIQVPARRVIRLTFTDMRMFDPVNCGTDYVELYNGISDSAQIFSRYCGDEIPGSVTTSSNTAFVKFVSNGVGMALGFRLTFTS